MPTPTIAPRTNVQLFAVSLFANVLVFRSISLS